MQEPDTPGGDFTLEASPPVMRRMRSIYEIRLRNLERILEENYGGERGARARLAEDLGVSATQISRYFLAGKYHQNIGDDMARRIETITVRPEGWMDQEHIDTELLAKTIVAVEELVDKLRFKIDAKRRAKLIAIAYEESLAAGKLELTQIRVIVGAMK